MSRFVIWLSQVKGDSHSFATVVRTLTWAVFVLLHADIADHLDGLVLPAGFVSLTTGQAIGYLGKGGQHRLQGGAEAPAAINKPESPKEGS